MDVSIDVNIKRWDGYSNSSYWFNIRTLYCPAACIYNVLHNKIPNISKEKHKCAIWKASFVYVIFLQYVKNDSILHQIKFLHTRMYVHIYTYVAIL